MLTLGIHGSFAREDEAPDTVWLHDASAAILRDGEIVAAIEEERLSRVKHTSAFPLRAIAHCLDAAGARLGDCDIIAYNQSEACVAIESRKRFILDRGLARRFDRDCLADLLEARFGGSSVAHRLRFCSHHLAHAWSAFCLSGFATSLVMCLDGGGENAPGPDLSGLVGRYDGESFSVLAEHAAETRSIGLWYRNAMSLLGYRLFDEYKVMGLAPYGNPETFAALADSWYTLLPDGDFALPGADAMAFFMSAHGHGLLEMARRRDEPLEQAHIDLACALQRAVEAVILHVATHYRGATGERSLCLAGGVAQNSSANGRLLRSGLFDRIFVQPAAYDAGGALGAALCAAHAEGERTRPGPLRRVDLGSDATRDPDAVAAELERWSPLVRFEHVGAGLERRVAQLLADGQVAGWVQGRSEFGPRALGHRSILGDPRPAANRDRVNGMIKKREGYRPFAPAVLAERASAYFDLPADCAADLGFMTFVVPVKDAARSLLGATTHVDGTARIQTVDAATNPRFYRLIAEFERLTGVPVLLNTSFNNNAEPIVESVRDAVATYLTSRLDVLVVGDVLVRAGVDLAADPLPCLGLRAAMRPSRRLVRSVGAGTGALRAAIELLSPVMEPPVTCSENMFALLAMTCDGTLRQRLAALSVPAGAHGAIAAEAFDLWQRRAIDLHP